MGLRVKGKHCKKCKTTRTHRFSPPGVWVCTRCGKTWEPIYNKPQNPTGYVFFVSDKHTRNAKKFYIPATEDAQ